MRRALLRNLSLAHRHVINYLPSTAFKASHSAIAIPLVSNPFLPSRSILFSSSSESDSSVQSPPETSLEKPDNKACAPDVEDVSNKELKELITEYFDKGNEEVLPSVFEAILKRRLSGKHEDTDDELMDELRMKPLTDVTNREFESDFEEAHETDEEIDNLYDARSIARKRMVKDEYFNMDDKKWDEMIKEATEHGFIKDTKECEDILDDMLNYDKLLPDEIKKKVEEKFHEIGEKVEKGELEPEEGYRLFKEFEDGIVLECAKLMEEEEPPQFDDSAFLDKKKNIDDPPGEGPVLRWQTRVVLSPGGDSWHPKNRKVKLAVTVKELGLSKHQFYRLRELVGKRYHPGKDELTITSERFEHREENRKDCLRTLFSLIEEAGKANKMVEEARVSYVKERLRANGEFMKRLHSKTGVKG